MEALGVQIRAKRKTLGLTLRELSKKVGISSSTLHKFEKGSLSPTVALMVHLCHELDAPVYDFLKENTTTFIHLKREDQKTISLQNINMKLIADYGLIDKNVNLSVLDVKEGAALPKHTEPLHVFVYVMKGRILLQFDGDAYEAREGEALYFDGSYPHSAQALTDAQLINIYIRGDQQALP